MKTFKEALKDMKDVENLYTIEGYKLSEYVQYKILILRYKQLLERATPKKLNDIVNYSQELYPYTGVCINCQTRISSDFDFCPNCGQALDWSAE